MCDDRIVIVGFGGHGKSVADAIVRQGKYSLAGIADMFFTQAHVRFWYLGKNEKLF